MELGKVWLRQPVTKVVARSKQRGLIIASDQGSCLGHQCRETLLTGETGSIVSVGASRDANHCPPRWEANG